MSGFSNPIYVHAERARVLERKALGDQSGAFTEAWLQKQLFLHPSALPLKEIAPHLGPIVPVCMELNTLAGPADILYVTTTGQVVLVETKLWRNPEARRTVVAQILDYAKELTNWHFEDLAREVARATGKGPTHLLDTVRARFPQLDEQGFVDGINHSLRTGDVVLLIVGDGIRTGTEALVGFLERYGSLRFSFGLIEVAAYELDGGVLLHPRVLAKTEIVRRTVVVPVDGVGNEVAVNALEETVSGEGPEVAAEQQEQTEYGQWLVDFWREYMARLELDDATQPKPPRPPKSTNAYFPMPPGGGQCWVSTYLARSWNRIGVYLAISRKFDRATEILEYLKSDREAIDASFKEPLEWRQNPDGSHAIAAGRPLGDWRDPVTRADQLAYLLDLTNRFVNVFRPRLEAFFRAEPK